jgi:hypothetical protein
MIRYLLLASLAFLLTPTGLRADPVLEYADRLFDEGMWDAAVTEYKRFVYFNSDSYDRHHCYERTACCYVKMGDYPSAIGILATALSEAPNDSLRQQRRIQSGIIRRDNGEMALAELTLARVATFSDDERFRRAAALLLAECQLRAFRWREAESTLVRSGILISDPEGPRLESIFADIEAQSLKSPRLALWLSTFLPGLGQVYAGSPLRGLHALALNASFAYMLTRTVIDEDIGNGLGIIGFAFRYYMGNRSNAEQAAVEHNQARLGPHLETAVERLHSMQAAEGMTAWCP